MAGFLYFLPERREQVPSGEVDQLPESLRDHLRGQGWAQGMVHDGPGGKAGIMIAPVPDLPGGRAPTLRHHPAEQRWHEVREGGKTEYWIGFELADRPSPLDLQRRGAVGGKPVRLLDDQSWLVPEIKFTAEGLDDPFPRGFEFDEFGRMRTRRLPGYDGLIDTAATVAGMLGLVQLDRDAEPTMADLFAFAADLLAVNYRVTPRECAQGLLGLFTTSSIWSVIWPALGVDELWKDLLAKKKPGPRGVGSAPTPGAGASTPA